MENFEKAGMWRNIMNSELQLVDDLHDSGQMMTSAYDERVTYITDLFQRKINEALGLTEDGEMPTL